MSVGTMAAAQSFGLMSLLHSSQALAANDDFKALVFIFLSGGNDSYNMVVPRGAGELRDTYEQGRRFAALPADSLHALNLANPANIYGGQSYNDFGLHPACADMAQLFNSGELSVVCNMGNLVEPTDRDQYRDDLVAVPPKLFSHSDQQRQFQSDVSGQFGFGWGGRMAELLSAHNANEQVSSLISIAGLNAFQVTKNGLINPYVMGSNGVIPLKNYKGLRKSLIETAMNGIDDSSHLMQQKYRDTYLSTIKAQNVVNNAFEKAAATGVDYEAIFESTGANDTKLGKQLKTVAKMIAGREFTGNNRPIYFVEMGGFDTHQNLLTDHQQLMTDLNGALKAFRDALVAQGDFDKVVSLVGSEFARTFTPNGNDETAGTDHAWGGHALLMGGMINGGQFFGTHPDLKLEQGLDASSGRGRWIPTSSTTQCVSVIADWFGIARADINQLFPSIDNFPSPFEPAANLQFFKGV